MNIPFMSGLDFFKANGGDTLFFSETAFGSTLFVAHRTEYLFQDSIEAGSLPFGGSPLGYVKQITFEEFSQVSIDQTDGTQAAPGIESGFAVTASLDQGVTPDSSIVAFDVEWKNDWISDVCISSEDPCSLMSYETLEFDIEESQTLSLS